MNDQQTLALYTCRTCGVGLEYQGVGRPPVFCSEHRPSSFPPLRSRKSEQLNGGLSRASDPDTSREAAARVNTVKTEQLIIEAFVGFGWLNDDELANLLIEADASLDRSTIKTARSRLSKTTPPTLVNTGTKRPSNRGCASIVWELA